MFRKLVILWTLFAVSLAAPQLGGFGSGGAGGFGNSFGGFGGNNDGFGAGLGDGIGGGIEDGIGAGFGDGIRGIGGRIGEIGSGLGTGLGAGFGTGLNTGLGTTFGTAFRNNVRTGLGPASVSSQSIDLGGGLNTGFGGISDIPSFGSPITSGIFSTASHHEKYPHKHPKYKFKYAVNDHHTGDQKSHEESRDGDRVRGMYSLVEPDGTIRRVEYTADDKNGFNAVVTRTGHAAHPPPQPHHHVKAVLPVLHSYH